MLPLPSAVTCSRIRSFPSAPANETLASPFQQLLNIAQRKRIAKIPPDCTEYEAGFGLPPFEDRRSGSHFAILSRHQPATLKVATHPLTLLGQAAG